MYLSTNQAIVDKKDPEYLRQRQAEYQREYRKREAEKRAKAKINEQIAQQYVATVPELQNKLLLMEGEIKPKDEIIQQYGNDLRAKDEIIQQYGNDLRAKDEQYAKLQEQLLSLQEEMNRLKHEIGKKSQEIDQLAPYANVGKVYSPFIGWLATQYPHAKADLEKYYIAYQQQLK
jgi:chromosome segregation ATPase